MSTRSLNPGYRVVRFGEVVKNANLVERDPEANDIERIVGLEHIDPENLHIRRWNSVADGTSFTRKFVPGQTLFGKRRAYQRKVAYAEFEGICSGDILTFEPKNRKVLLPELLPFICQSDAFFDHALDTSAGSLSPRTSWAALKDFEFSLPPLDEQRRIAEILWAADDAVEKYKLLSTDIEKARDTFIDELCTALPNDIGYVANTNIITKPLGEISAVTKLAGFEFTKFMKYIPDGEIIALRALNIKNNKLDLVDIKKIAKSVSDGLPRSKLYADDILITYIGAYIGDILRISENDKYHLAPNIAKITADSSIIAPEMLEWLLRSKKIQNQMRQLTTTTATPSLTMTQIRNLKVTFPRNLDDQSKLVEAIRKFNISLGDSVNSREALTLIAKQMLRNIGEHKAGVIHV